MHSFTDHSTLLEHRRSRLEALVGRSDYITAYHPSQLSRLFSHLFSGMVDWLTQGSMPHISKTMQIQRFGKCMIPFPIVRCILIKKMRCEYGWKSATTSKWICQYSHPMT